MAAITRKLFHIGKLPAGMLAEVATEGVLHRSEFFSVWLRFAGRVPGQKATELIRGYGGALVLTQERVLATVSSMPWRAGRAVDQPWTAQGPASVTGTLSKSGLALRIEDLSRVDPLFSGALSLTFQTTLSADVLWQVPTRTIAFDVPPLFVYSVLGVPQG
ncbi:hypothetical protein [Mycolicibacterium parafortuitum]|uniref:hypothetical protein n=1 Tax=Mycolicibacterium parafortuitum TaxID=39692 RepID=UPI0032C43010